MAITFQPVDAKSPSALPQPGYYYGKIIDAVMRQPKDVTKNPYLNITYELYDGKKDKCGRLYDIITDSDKPFNLYRLQRFGQALGLVGKSLELSDLTKIIINKTIIFRLKIDKNEQYGDKAVVDISDEGIYYAKSEANNFFEPIKNDTVADAPAPIEDTSDDSAPFDVDDEDEF